MIDVGSTKGAFAPYTEDKSNKRMVCGTSDVKRTGGFNVYAEAFHNIGPFVIYDGEKNPGNGPANRNGFKLDHFKLPESVGPCIKGAIN